MPSYRSLCGVLLPGLFLAALLTTSLTAVHARADFGPKLRAGGRDGPQLEILLDGQPLRKTPITIAILESGPSFGSVSSNSIAGFEGPPEATFEHARWLQTIRATPVGPLRLNGFSSRGDAILLLVRLRDEPRVYVSNSVELHPLFGEFRCELTSATGDTRTGVTEAGDAGTGDVRVGGAEIGGSRISTATLTLNTSGRAWVDWLLAIWRRGFGLALATTLCVEGAITVAWALWRKAAGGRLLLRCLLGNLLTLPVVWATTLVAFALTCSIPAGLIVLGLGEVGALVVESCVFGFGFGWASRVARGDSPGGNSSHGGLSWRDAIALVTLANVSSFAAGVAWSHADSMGLS